MICPACNANEDKVIDSRSTEAGKVIRRRRQCLACARRFTTYERVEQATRLVVVKKDGSRVPFQSDSIIRGVSNACGKRPIAEDVKQKLAEEVEEELHAEFEREVHSSEIGERVMTRLRNIDRIAYIRFATEHLQLSTLAEIQRELDDLSARPMEGVNQQGLFNANQNRPRGSKP
ncbi:MAG: transcriptional repressor NrdR [Phycisphaeraceae bacterium]|nr:MAG: transcriptional repressor NrdR [Phycisphaeraceae bacterium]